MKHVFKRVPLSQFTNTMSVDSVQDNLRVGKKKHWANQKAPSVCAPPCGVRAAGRVHERAFHW